MKLIHLVITSAIAISLMSCAEKEAPTASDNPSEIQQVQVPELNKSDQIVKGEKLYVLCQACHAIDASASRKIGPHLQGIMQRKIASLDSFAYSPALKKVGGNWDENKMDEWLRSPQKLAPGNMMAFMGMPDAEARLALIAYLKTL